MAHGIHYCLSNGKFGQFVMAWRNAAAQGFADFMIDATHDKRKGLLYHVNQSAVKNLVRRDGPLDLPSPILKTFHL
jgi:hypothetical protein